MMGLGSNCAFGNYVATPMNATINRRDRIQGLVYIVNDIKVFFFNNTDTHS